VNARLSQLALVILIALGFGLLYAPHHRPPEPTPTAPVTPQVASAVPSIKPPDSPSTPVLPPTDLEGVWTQYCQVDGETVWLCKLRLEQTELGYQAETVDVAPEANPPDVITSEHRYDGTRWTFQSDWGARGMATFDLQRTGPDEFQGYATVGGEQEDLLFTFKRETE